MRDSIVVDKLNKSFKSYSQPGYNTLKEGLIKGLMFRRKASQNRLVLKNISFSVPAGTVLGIIGFNGSGKSTLLKLIAGIFRPDSGKVSANGRISALLSLGVGFHPDLSGRENIYVNALALGLSKKEVKAVFDEIVHFAELEEFIEAPVRTYSTGMYMRLGFSIAVNIDPDILLLDEVTSVGDQRFQTKSSARINRFKEEGKTILVVTHDLSLVENWCHQALWIDGGVVRDFGDPASVTAKYRAKGEMIQEAPKFKKLSDLHRYKLGTRLLFGDRGNAYRHQLWGWSALEDAHNWTEGVSAGLGFLFSEPIERSLNLKISMNGLIKPPQLPFQPVDVYANDVKVGQWEVADKKDYEAVIPNSLLEKNGALIIKLDIPKASSPASPGINEDLRLLGVCCFEMELSN